MGDIAHGYAAHRVRRALERVHGAEKRRDFLVLGGSGCFFESEDRPGHHLQMLRGLGREVRNRFGMLGEEMLEIGEERVRGNLSELGTWAFGNRLRLTFVGQRRQRPSARRARRMRWLRANGRSRGRLRFRVDREELGISGAEPGDGSHVLPAIVADHVEHSPHRGHHVFERLDHAPLLRRRLSRKLFEQALHHECHRGDHRVSMEGGSTLEPMSDYHEWIDDCRGRRIASGQPAHALLDGGHRLPGLHQEDAEDELVVLIVQHPGSLRANSGPRET